MSSYTVVYYMASRMAYVHVRTSNIFNHVIMQALKEQISMKDTELAEKDVYIQQLKVRWYLCICVCVCTLTVIDNLYTSGFNNRGYAGPIYECTWPF